MLEGSLGPQPGARGLKEEGPKLCRPLLGSPKVHTRKRQQGYAADTREKGFGTQTIGAYTLLGRGGQASEVYMRVWRE